MAETFARIIDGHLGLAATSRPVALRRVAASIGLASIDSITLSERGSQEERSPSRRYARPRQHELSVIGQHMASCYVGAGLHRGW